MPDVVEVTLSEFCDIWNEKTRMILLQDCINRFTTIYLKPFQLHTQVRYTERTAMYSVCKKWTSK